MMPPFVPPEQHKPLPILIISGGNGASGRQMVDTVLVQYPDLHTSISMKTSVRTPIQVEEAVAEAATLKSLIVHTLVDDDLRKLLQGLAARHKLVSIDLMGPLFNHITALTGHQPLELPGLYRTLHQHYYHRVAAIEFAMEHDDGQRTEDLPEAEIVLIGVSRSGKTPLSMYLAVLGWKVANVVMIPEVDPPQILFEIDRRRVFALDIDHERLLLHRRDRQERLGGVGVTSYTQEAAVFDEIENARRFFRKHRFTPIDVTDNAIEASASKILDLISQRLGK